MGKCKHPMIPEETIRKSQNSPLAPYPAVSSAEKTVDDVLRRFGEEMKKRGSIIGILLKQEFLWDEDQNSRAVD